MGVISLTVTLSVVLHGATAAIGARRYAAHASKVRDGAQDAEMDTEMEAEMESMLPRTRWSLGRGQA